MLGGAVFDALAEDGGLLATWVGHLGGAILGSVGLSALRAWDWGSLGVRLGPRQGWWYWARVALFAGMAAVLLGLGYLYTLGREQVAGNVVRIDGRALVHFVVAAPLLEEAVYRLVVCSVVSRVLGGAAAVVASGVVFAFVHLLGRNVDPVNLIAGFLFAWSFLHSGSIVVPVALHAGGNILALLANVALGSYAA